VLAVGRARAGVLLREVRDGVRGRVLTAETADKRIIGFAGFGESVVAGVEVLALLELVLEEVLLVRELAVEAEELLFFFGEGLVGCEG
jgi:ABC-type proline/glycine betaine transport system permease subunit